jgi:hypothetical protein
MYLFYLKILYIFLYLYLKFYKINVPSYLHHIRYNTRTRTHAVSVRVILTVWSKSENLIVLNAYAMFISSWEEETQFILGAQILFDSNKGLR